MQCQPNLLALNNYNRLPNAARNGKESHKPRCQLHCNDKILANYQAIYTIVPVEYEWDEEKDKANIAAGRLGFAAIQNFEWQTAVIQPSPRSGESRWAAIGYIEDRLHYVVYTTRGDRVRIISLRRASRQEERFYAQT